MDHESIKKMATKHMRSKVYERIQADWQGKLLKKQRKRAQKLERDALKTEPESEEQKLVLHNPGQPIEYPQDPYGIFAIIEINGKQYKVTKDVTVMTEKIPYEVGDKLVLDQVLMIGTKDYTSIGRPVVESARVYASVEDISNTQNVIVFKKKRRQGYQKNQGHRQTVYNLRIENIVHLLG